MIETLKALLVPGGRSRISPYIQDAQYQILFGESPSAQDRHESLRALLIKNKESVQRLADTYKRFAQSKRQFLPVEYISEDFLRLYLAYYFTTNVCKIQLCLLDHVAANRIPNKLTIVDIGVGTGTTAVAVLDFLLAWTTICHLHNQSFPVEHVEILCYDVSQQCINIAEKVVLTYCKIISQRSKLFSENSAMSTAFKLISKWGTSTKWIYHDMSDGPIRHSAGNSIFLFASNVLTELTPKGRASLDLSISTMGCGSIANIIEPGDKDSCVGLNTWRNLLLSNHDDLRVIAPCETHARAATNPCCSCWNSRRESLHQPPLYLQLRELTHDPRSFDDYLNNLLSWSYTVISNDSRFVSSSHNDDPSHLITKAFGVFRWGKEKQQFFDSALDTDAPEDHCYIDYLKLCPASYPGAAELWARREPGFILPPIPHGTPLRIIGGQVEQSVKKPGIFTLKLTQSTKVVAEIPKSNTQSFLDKYNDTARQAIDEIAFRLFGFAAMRSFQHEILGRVLMGHSILGIAATGGGKSECYILPALLFSGVTIVISPLKSLMQDQYEKRIDERYGLKNLTTYINGDVPFIERQARLKRIELGHYKLVYFTPEQLRQSHVLNSLKRSHDSVGIRYLALDEAHCISQWGHDFRDSYLNIVTRLTATGINPVIIALTATASPEVRADLCEELHLINEPVTNGGDVYVYSSNRAELNLIVKPLQSTHEKTEDILSRLQSLLQNNKEADNPDAAIVFMPHTGTAPNDTSWSSTLENESTNRGRFSARVTSFASYLERALETRVAIYHGKMDFDTNDPTITKETEKKLGDLSDRSRRSEQTDFIEGKRSIMVATKGFGMGIDKPNIRLIIHRTPTSNLESYAQEAGRAGRDGQISDVILYYSPDKTSEDTVKENNDYDIQDFFLSQKYIRRDDVIAIKKFFENTEILVNGLTYFTSDEVVPFFDHLEQRKFYTWPTFSPRKERLKESYEHAKILNQGHFYLQKINYIERILSALYRFRFNTDKNKKFAILDTYQETGAVLCCINNYPSVCNSEAIINSNYYFGDLLRKKQVSPSDFNNWIKRCCKDNIIEFSLFLGLSISETASMLWDINRSSGYIYNGRWKSDLLDFIYIGTPKHGQSTNISLAQLRDYYGASKRASKSEALRRAEYARNNGEHRDYYKGEISPSLDDWFGLKELTTPKGWEVCFGNGLKNEKIFLQYVDEFMKLHDLRKKNDRAAYNLLLTDYIGVKEDGSLSVNNDDKPCLRAVLLGYLKTGEVVLGNCGSCSRCVTNGKFEKDITKREKVVERLGIEILNLLDLIEKSNLRMPTADLIKKLWRHVESQEAEGKSLRPYVGGWTGRVLTDYPKHKAALLIRIDGMLKGLLPLHPNEVCTRALELVEIISTKELNTIWDTIHQFEKILPDMPEAMEVRATALQKLEKFEQARDLWQTLTNQSTSKQLLHKCHSNLANLTDLRGPLADESHFIKHAIQAARTTNEITVSTEFYNRAQTFWSWSDFKQELEYRLGQEGEIFVDKLISWWIDLRPGIASLASYRPPEDWHKVIDASLPGTEVDNSEISFFDKKIVNNLDEWTNDIITKNPTFYPVRALRFALLLATKRGNRDESIYHFLKLIEEKKENLQKWLSTKVNSAKIDNEHYSIKFMIAEINFQEKNYSSAKDYWQTYIETPPLNIPLDLIKHALLRLINIYEPKGPLPNNTCCKLVYLALARRSSNWNDAAPFYRKILLGWTTVDIKEEVIKILFPNHYDIAFNLILSWIELHKRPNDSSVILDILNLFENSIIDKYSTYITKIVLKLHPNESTLHPIFGPMCLQHVVQTINDITQSTDKYSQNDQKIEFLVYATFNNLIDMETVQRLRVQHLLFENASNYTASLLARELGPTVRNNIKNNKPINLFYNCSINSVKALTRFMHWFMFIYDLNSDISIQYQEIIWKSTESLLKRSPKFNLNTSEFNTLKEISTKIPVFATVYNLLNAEYEFTNKNYHNAAKYWDLYIKTPPPDAPKNIIKLVLNRLIDTHNANKLVVDESKKNATLLALARNSITWESADPYFRTIMPSWNVNRLDQEIQFNVKNNKSTFNFFMILKWTEIHKNSDETAELLYILERIYIDSKSYTEIIKSILNNLNQKIIFNSYNFFQIQLLNIQNKFNDIFYGIINSTIKITEIRNSVQKFHYSEIEFLTYAFYAGKIYENNEIYENILLAILIDYASGEIQSNIWHLADNNGRTVAHKAAKLGKLPENFVSWDIADPTGWSVAHEAAKHHNLPQKFDKWLLSDGKQTVADLAFNKSILKENDLLKNNCNNLIEYIFKSAALSGFLPESNESWKMIFSDGNTYAHIYATNHILTDSSCWEIKNSNGDTVAHIAAQNNRLPENFDQWNLMNDSGDTVAHIIAKFKNPRIPTKYLIIENKKGETPLYIAAINNHIPNNSPLWMIKNREGKTIEEQIYNGRKANQTA